MQFPPDSNRSDGGGNEAVGVEGSHWRPGMSVGRKANIALGRKFLGVIYRTLKNNWGLEDFSNFVLAS